MKNFKRIIPTVMIASALLLSGCSGKTGNKATNMDESTGEVISQELDQIKGDTIKNIKDIVKNAPSISNLSISDSANFDLNSELTKRKNNFVICDSESKVEGTDIVNVSFIEVSLSSGESVYEINVGYDFSLSSDLDSTFKNGLIGKNVGDKVTIEDCKLPGDVTAKVKVKINYITRKIETLDSLNSLIPEGAENYEKWLEDELKKNAMINDAWTQILSQATVDESNADYKEYFNRKYNNAHEYYLIYNNGEVDEAALKEVIKNQVKKEFVAFYYADEYDIELGEYKDEEIKNIALYYGYTVEAFEAKYSKETIESTILVDLVGQKIYKDLTK